MAAVPMFPNSVALRTNVAASPIAPYHNDPAFLREYTTIDKAGDPESRTSGVANIILNHYFPSTQGYVHRPEDYVLDGFVDINTHQWVAVASIPVAVRATLQPPTVTTPEVQAHFMITQCKAAKHETSNSTWSKAEDQMLRYMREMSTRNAWNCPLFGFISVGRQVRFYRWNPRTRRRRVWGSHLELVANGPLIHAHMVWIQQHHI